MRLLNSRNQMIQYIEKRRLEGAKVIDFGGSANSWSYPHIDSIADININNKLNKNIFYCDFNNGNSFKNIKKHEISITSHTLEDIRSPNILLDKLELLSDEGFIIVPSPYIECSYVESFNYLGYCHHRWLFKFKNNKITIYPKLSSINNFFPTTIDFKKVFPKSFNTLKKLDYPFIFVVNYLVIANQQCFSINFLKKRYP